MTPLASRRIREPRFLLVFPPQQFAADEMKRPDGTLALAYLDAALTSAGFASRIVDMSVGTAADRLADTFFRAVPLDSERVRIGMSPERIVEETRDADVVAVTSIFTQQTSRCLEVAEVVRTAHPDKLLVAGGVNARALREHFLDRGFDAVFLSESERAIVAFARFLHCGEPVLGDIPGIAFRAGGRTVTTPAGGAVQNLDELPIPAWDKLPLAKYWEIGRIWGGKTGWMEGVAQPRYAAILTSRGCPFRCTYCHISKERGGEAGDIGDLRLHSPARVEQELEHLRSLGVEYLFVNDDSFLAKKERVFSILAMMRRFRFRLADVNGVNIVHLFTRRGARLAVDRDLIDALRDAGFRKISLPFESGSQRLLDKYSSAKWRLAECDPVDLVRQLRDAGIAVDGNFMIGYPDESPEELTETFMLARRLMDAGLVGCQFFMVQPFPGTQLFDTALAEGQLAADWHWDDLGWSKGSPFLHPRIDKATLKYCWSLVWKLLNPPDRIAELNRHLEATDRSS